MEVAQPIQAEVVSRRVSLDEVAVTLRSLQFYAHIAHNLTAGLSFLADHAFLGEAYRAYETAYDDIVERMVGLKFGIDLFAVTQQAAAKTAELAGVKDCDGWLRVLRDGEAVLQRQIEAVILDGSLSQGTINLLAGVADASESRSYKLNQRLWGAL